MSLLVKLGIIQAAKPEDKEPVPFAAPAATPASSVPTSGSILTQAVTVAKSTASTVNLEEINGLAANLEEELKKKPELDVLFKFLETSNKLSQVADLKIRYTSALSILGIEANALLNSAEAQEPALNEIVKITLDQYLDETKPQVDNLAQEVDQLNATLENLKAQQAAAEEKLATVKAMLQTANDDYEHGTGSLTLARKQISDQFDVVRSDLYKYLGVSVPAA